MLFFFGKGTQKKPRHYVYFGLFLSILDFEFGADVCGKSRLASIFTPFATMPWRGPPLMARIMVRSSYEMVLIDPHLITGPNHNDALVLFLLLK